MTQAEGEKEIILGNKQLISLFFVVVVLCGVFFAVGYMIGRSGAKPETSAVTAANSDGGGPATPGSAPQETEPPRETPAESSPPADNMRTNAVKASPLVTQPAHDVPPPAQTEAGVSALQPGATYLQVTALRRADADNLAKTLREQNFPVLIADSSKPDLFRVLVGPYHQTAEVADVKAKLKALGFADAFVQK